MNRDTKPTALPALTANLLREGGCLIDNLFADIWKQVGMKNLLNRFGFHKRSGTSAPELVYCLMLWVWLKVDSISLFAKESLQTFSNAEKDALYEVMNREDWNWRRLHREVAQQAVREMKASSLSSAFVLDDSIRIRHGKKVPGVSSHFDHTSGRHVMGQQGEAPRRRQDLTLGLSCAEGFVPVDSELFISAVKAQGLHQAFRDRRSVVAKRYRGEAPRMRLEAEQQTKPGGVRFRRCRRTARSWSRATTVTSSSARG